MKEGCAVIIYPWCITVARYTRASLSNQSHSGTPTITSCPGRLFSHKRAFILSFGMATCEPSTTKIVPDNATFGSACSQCLTA